MMPLRSASGRMDNLKFVATLLLTAVVGLTIGVCSNRNEEATQFPFAPVDHLKSPTGKQATEREEHQSDQPGAENAKTHSEDGGSGPVEWSVTVDPNAAAKEAYDLINDATERGIPLGQVEAAAKFRLLNEKTASWLVDRYRNGLSNGKVDTTALDLAIRSGGPIVAELIQDRLNAKDKSELERMNLMMALGGISGWASLDKVPISSEFQSIAMKLVASEDDADRRGGAGLLGWLPGMDSRTTLIGCYENDRSPTVKAAAVMSLSRLGDHMTLQTLRNWQQMLDSSLPGGSIIEKHLKSAIGVLEARLGVK